MKRISDRVPARLNAVMSIGHKRYTVTIGNFSENGMYMEIDPVNTAVDCSHGTVIDLKFQIPSGEKLSLHCRIIWTGNVSPDGPVNTLGLTIAEPSPLYDEFFKGLYMNNRLVF